MVVVSSHSREMAEEVYSSKPLDSLSDVSVSAALARVVLGGGYSIRLLDVSGSDFDEIKSDAIDLEGGMVRGWVRVCLCGAASPATGGCMHVLDVEQCRLGDVWGWNSANPAVP